MRNGFRTVIKVLERIEDAMAYIGGVLILFMVLSICYEIVLRYFFSKPTLWVVGVVEYILFSVTFLGAGWLLKRNGHVVIDIGLSLFSEKGRAILNIITSGLSLVSCMIMAWYGAKSTYDFLVRRVMTAQDPEIPKFILLAFVPLGFFFLVVEFIRKGLDNLSIWKSLKPEKDM